MKTIETMDHVREGVDFLCRSEPRFRDVLALTGLPPLRRRHADLEGLLNIVVSQQVSKASAEAIQGRMRDMYAPFDAGRLVDENDDDFRLAGLSRPKMRTIRALSAAVLEGTLDLEAVSALDDDAVRETLTAVRGIGPWTADIFLLVCLGRQDAWPAGDLALQVAAREMLSLNDRPDIRVMDKLSAAWRPWRGVAARLLWAYYSAARAREVVP